MSAWDEGDSAGLERLASLLREAAPRLLSEWEEASRQQPAARRLERPALADHLGKVLERLIQSLDGRERGRLEEGLADAAEAHARSRLAFGFLPHEVLHEYHLLRQVLRRVLLGQSALLGARTLVALEERLDQAVLQAARALSASRGRLLNELERIFDAALELLELDSLLPLLLNVLQDSLSPMDVAVLLLRDGNLLKVRAAVGEGAEAVRGMSVEIGEGIPGRIAAEKAAVTLRFAVMDPVVDRGLLRGMRALYGVPLMYGDSLEGVAYMASRTLFEFSDYDKALFRALCGRATALIVHHRLAARERAARAEARYSQGQLDAMLAASPIGVAFFDREMRYVRINDALAAINGKPVQEHLGRDVRDVIPEVAENLVPFFKEILATGKTFTNLEISTTLPERPHELRWFIANYHPVRLEHGEIAGVVVVLVEITARKRAEAALRESEERFRTLVDGLRDFASFTLDARGRISAWNGSAQRMFGYAAHELVGQPASRLYTAADAQAGKAERLLQRAASEGRVEVSAERVRKDGTTFRAQCSVTAMKDEAGNVQGYTVMTRELSARPEPPQE